MTTTFYSFPMSANARRVWVTLLEKQIPFERVELKLDGDQFAPEFTAINPLQRVPVLVDDGIRVVESLAILDYLEAKYPQPALMPTEPGAIATVRMVEAIAVCELQPLTLPIMQQAMQFPVTSKQVEAAQSRTATLLDFLEQHLCLGSPYFIGADFTRADIVAGTLLPALPMLGISLALYPKLQTWLARISQRPSWQQTELQPDAVASGREQVQQILERRGLL